MYSLYKIKFEILSLKKTRLQPALGLIKNKLFSGSPPPVTRQTDRERERERERESDDEQPQPQKAEQH